MIEWEPISEDIARLHRVKGEGYVAANARQLAGKDMSKTAIRQEALTAAVKGGEGDARMEDYLTSIRDRVIPETKGKKKGGGADVPPPPAKPKPPMPPPGGDDPELLASLARPKRGPGGGSSKGGTPPVKQA